jgi:hypothetical protein
MYLSNSNPKVNAMQAKLQEQLSPADAEVILRRLPERIQAAPITRAAKIEYPISFAAAIANRCDLFAVSSSHAGRTSINIVKFITDRRIAISGTV